MIDGVTPSDGLRSKNRRENEPSDALEVLSANAGEATRVAAMARVSSFMVNSGNREPCAGILEFEND